MTTADPARGPRRFFLATVVLLGVDAAVFGWAVYPEILGLPIRGETTEWTAVAVSLFTGALGIVLLGAAVLSGLHVHYARKEPPAPP